MSARPVEERGSITAHGPVSGIQVHHHMQFGPTAVFNLDLQVVVQLAFMLQEQARRLPDEDPLVVTPITVWERLKELGVPSGNGSGLIGKNAVYESFARLIAKGYVRRIPTRSADRRRAGPVSYQYYENPAWNPDWAPPLESLQVSSGSGNAGSGIATSGTAGSRTNQSFPQVGSTSGIAGSGIAGSSTFPQVSSTSGNAGNPPHPPEEVGTTSSPSPPKRRSAAAGGGSAAAPSGEAPLTADVDPKQLQAAVDFLMRLPGKWAVGRLKVRGLATELVRALEDTGWKLDAALRLWLTRTEEGKAAPRSHATVLEFRIKNLELREAVLAVDAGDGPPDRAAGAQRKPWLPDWCGKCNDGVQPMSLIMRTIADPDLESDKVIPCPDCHPSRVRRAN
ncbi:hypothetical protein [Kitasatospora sp. NPDC090091]|uniref:hypothetical protein n=1 Tax=Kitasatospora sp. NPDC090091 TaxID=3364081 RepID=UPI003807776C